MLQKIGTIKEFQMNYQDIVVLPGEVWRAKGCIVLEKFQEGSMKILLLDNAMDSLEWAVRHLESFLKQDAEYSKPNESTTYLKQAILCLNSALELFFKAKISEINPILIYNNLSTNDMHQSILEYYSKK